MSMKEKNTEFTNRFAELAKTADEAMEKYISEQAGVPDVLRESMLYSIRAGGKRLRPVMVMLACEACGGVAQDAIAPASAIEMIHTYSLIHDDLPAMDDDDFRRGRPTNHKVYGEGPAILAGDALLTFAFAVITRYTENGELARKLVIELADGSGAAGMVGGQSADLSGEDQDNNIETLQYIHTNKTARLFQTSMKMGALCAGASEETIEAMSNFGLTLGLAFQVVDDLLDVTSTAEKMGKQTQKDADAGKMTYPALLGIEKSQALADELYTKALNYLEIPGLESDNLRNLAVLLVERDN